jgi:hypothetical protein
MNPSLEYLQNAIDLLARHYGVERDARPAFDFSAPKGLLDFYERFPDPSVFDGQDFVRSEPCPLGTDWYGTQIEPNLLELAYENQAVWILATQQTDCDDATAYIINDVEITKYDSLNLYLAAFLLNQTVWNRGRNVLTEIPSTSHLWLENGFIEFSDGWKKPGAIGYESFMVSDDGQIIVGFHHEPWAVVVANDEIPNWLTTTAG